MSTFFGIKPHWMVDPICIKNRVIRYLSVRITDNPLKIWLLIRNPSQPSHTYRPRNLKPLCSMVHFLVLSSHISMTSILPNNTAMLPPFSVFMNFHPNLSDSHSGLIRGFFSAVAVLRLVWSMTSDGCVPKKHQLCSKEALRPRLLDFSLKI